MSWTASCTVYLASFITVPEVLQSQVRRGTSVNLYKLLHRIWRRRYSADSAGLLATWCEGGHVSLPQQSQTQKLIPGWYLDVQGNLTRYDGYRMLGSRRGSTAWWKGCGYYHSSPVWRRPTGRGYLPSRGTTSKPQCLQSLTEMSPVMCDYFCCYW